jgi:hypothetical protein
MAKAKVTPKKKGPVPYAMKDCHRGCNLLLGRKASRLDPARNGQGRSEGGDVPRSSSGERRLEPPVTSSTELLPHSKDAASMVVSVSKLDRHGVIKGAQPKDVMIYTGRRTTRTGLEHTFRGASIGYNPAPGVITNRYSPP